MISRVRVASSAGLVLVATRIVQLAPFQLWRVVPSHESPLTSPSSSDPSHLQTGSESVMTIQFH
jgi:hypothetical protein